MFSCSFSRTLIVQGARHDCNSTVTGPVAVSADGPTKAFKAGGSTTAGNSSQVTDGAAMVLLARYASRMLLVLVVILEMPFATWREELLPVMPFATSSDAPVPSSLGFRHRR